MKESSRKLALSIRNCCNFEDVVSRGAQNPCRKIIDWQMDKHGPFEVEQDQARSMYHSPEPWAGNLEEAPIMFLSSNPSFDPKEAFPTLEWNDDDAADFFVNRFSTDLTRRYGATDGPGEKNQDRVVLNDGSLTKKVRTWNALRRRAAVLLDKPLEQTTAASDYVMTEVVHCKSQKEHGVPEALYSCVAKWFESVLGLSGAKLVVVSGWPAGVAVKQALAQLSPHGQTLSQRWGSWKGEPVGSGLWPGSWPEVEQWRRTGTWNVESQLSHIEEVDLSLAGGNRRFTFLWMPHPIRSVPQTLDDPRLFDREVLDSLRSTVR